jgi:uncharacterized membrane protein affecting hemolysin expression
MFLTLSFVILEKQKVFLNESNINQSKNRTNSLAVNSASWLMSNDYIGLQEVVDSISSYKDEVHIMIVDLKGKIVAHSDKSKVGQYLVDDLSVKHLNSLTKNFEVLKLYSTKDNHFIEVASPIFYKNQLLGYVRNRMDNKYWINSFETIKNEFYVIYIYCNPFCHIICLFKCKYSYQNFYNLIDVTKKIKAGEKILKLMKML